MQILQMQRQPQNPQSLVQQMLQMQTRPTPFSAGPQQALVPMIAESMGAAEVAIPTGGTEPRPTVGEPIFQGQQMTGQMSGKPQEGHQNTSRMPSKRPASTNPAPTQARPSPAKTDVGGFSVDKALPKSPVRSESGRSGRIEGFEYRPGAK